MEISSLLINNSFFDPPIDFVNDCNTQRTPEYLKIGIIELKKIEAN